MPVSERSFSVDDLIQLPRFDAVSAVVLGDRIVQAANAEAEIPPPVRRAKEALDDALTNLRRAAEARVALASAGDPAVVADADRMLDGCWTALYDWLTGFSKLPDGTREANEARGLLTELYPDGLSFILLPYELEWHQSDLRLSRLDNEPLGERIRDLGGKVFLDALTRAHNAYGKLLGLPRAAGAKEQISRGVGEALEAFASALRVYALKVTAQVEVEDPGTAEMCNRLLDPLLNWRTIPRSSDVELTLY